MKQTSFLKSAKAVWLIPILIWVVATLVRSWSLNDYLFWGFEQGRDAAIIQTLYTFKDFTLIGPKTDVDGVFHGPWYYYLMTWPYWLGQGQPLMAGYFLAALGGLVPVFVYGLALDWYKRRWVAVMTAGVAIFSMQLINYSRWLSNVSPAVLAVTIGFWGLWKYHQTNKAKFLWIAAAAISLSIQFEIILVIQWGLVFAGLLISRWFKAGHWRDWLVGVGVGLLVSAPLILFDFRNQHLLSNGALKLLTGDGHGKAVSITEAFDHYWRTLARVINESWFSWSGEVAHWWFWQVVLVWIIWWRKGISPEMKLLFWWCWMSLPLIMFSSSLYHLYVGSAVGWILLFGAGLNWLSSKLSVKQWLAVCVLLMIPWWLHSAARVYRHQDVFFITNQTDLVYRDQLALLNWIKQSSGGESFQFDSHTVPYLYPQGWDYLVAEHLPGQRVEKSDRIYIAIERGVDSISQQKWIDGLGPSILITEQKFGELRVQFRQRLDASELQKVVN